VRREEQWQGREGDREIFNLFFPALSISLSVSTAEYKLVVVEERVGHKPGSVLLLKILLAKSLLQKGSYLSGMPVTRHL
jgi:hypothetical protein